MALYAFDGTWNSEKTGEDPSYTNTNVVRFANAYRRNSTTADLYVAGVGTRFDLVGHVLGGAFGLGELARLDDAYDHLCRQWAAGDSVIDIVGFSRGAATTLDFCNVVQERGIRAPGTDRTIQRSPTIRFVGVWDVVGAFGIANLGATDLNIGHHLQLPRGRVTYAFHALALDERRPSFIATRVRGACEVWFRGVHSDVGGGNGNRGLNDIALKWMMWKAHAAGLPITAEEIAALEPDPSASPKFESQKALLDIRLIDPLDRRHYSVAHADGCRNPPDSCPIETVSDEQVALKVGEALLVLPPLERARIAALYDVAVRTAGQLDFSIAGVREGLLALIQSRVVLIHSDRDMRRAADATVTLVSEMVRLAKQRDFHTLNEFFLTEALFDLGRLFPYDGRPRPTTSTNKGTS